MTDRTKVLVIDDEPAIRRFLHASLPEDEYDLLEAGYGEQGVRMTATENPQIVLLDLGLPDLDGMEVARRIREWSQVPIIVLSARGRESDKVQALDEGADDYLTKPFGVKELLARIRVALRHAMHGNVSGEIAVVVDGVKIDLSARQVFLDGVEVRLTPNEYNLLAALARHPGMVLTHKQLLLEVWGPAYVDETHYLRVYMGQLRNKLERDAAKPRFLRTEPGVGYRLVVED